MLIKFENISYSVIGVESALWLPFLPEHWGRSNLKRNKETQRTNKSEQRTNCFIISGYFFKDSRLRERKENVEMRRFAHR